MVHAGRVGRHRHKASSSRYSLFFLVGFFFFYLPKEENSAIAFCSRSADIIVCRSLAAITASRAADNGRHGKRASRADINSRPTKERRADIFGIRPGRRVVQENRPLRTAKEMEEEKEMQRPDNNNTTRESRADVPDATCWFSLSQTETETAAVSLPDFCLMRTRRIPRPSISTYTQQFGRHATRWFLIYQWARRRCQRTVVGY